MSEKIIDIDCKMNLIIVKRNNKFVVTDATILTDDALAVDLDRGAGHVPTLIAQAKLNCIPVSPLSGDGYFTISTSCDQFVEWVKMHVSEIRSGIE